MENSNPGSGLSRAANQLTQITQKIPKNILWGIGIAVILAILLYRPLLMVSRDSGINRHYPLLADAFLHGRLDVDSVLQDDVIVDGKNYVPFPPFPAIILIPQVALLGVRGTSGILAGILISLVSGIFFLLILRELEIGMGNRLWLLAAFFLGTGYWISLIHGHIVYYFAHLVAICCMFISIWVSMRYGSGWLSGLMMGLAFLSRQLTIFGGIFILITLWNHQRNDTPRKKWIAAAAFLTGLGLCVLVYLFYNWARFGDPFQTGYSLINLAGFLQSRVEKYGLFNIAYIPVNFIYMFLQGPNIVFGGPRYMVPVGMDPYGTSLLFASPFIILAVRAHWNTAQWIAAWISIGCILFGALLYYNNGWVQTNMQRFSLDFLPILILLVAQGMKRDASILWKFAILFSIGLNLFVVGLLL